MSSLVESGQPQCVSSVEEELNKAPQNNVSGTPESYSPVNQEMQMISLQTETGTSQSQVAHFFSGRSIFITGSTGFLGKVLIEKLLRCCSGVSKVYLLLRSKRDLNAVQRLAKLYDEKVFKRLHKEQPNAWRKLVAVSGNVAQPQLGLDQTDQEILVQNVSVVFHCAANIRLNESLKRAVEVNVLGTRRVLELSQRLPLLQALVHVSTAYSNCDKLEVEEVIYPSLLVPQNIINFVELPNEDKLVSRQTEIIVGNKRNTYMYTKSLTEKLLSDEYAGLPLAVVRPSIVTSADKEPYPGWAESRAGILGVLTAVSTGLVKTLFGERGVISDSCPVDLVVNLLLTVAWHTSTQMPNDIVVYNCTSGTLNPLTNGQIMHYANLFLPKYPSMKAFCSPMFLIITNRLLNLYYVWFEEYLPAACIDVILLCKGTKPKMFQLCKKIRKAFDDVEYFRLREWKFECGNVTSLYQLLNSDDKKIFGFDFQQLDWPTYYENMIKGIREYNLKEDPSTIPAAIARLKKLSYVANAIKSVIFLGIICFVICSFLWTFNVL